MGLEFPALAARGVILCAAPTEVCFRIVFYESLGFDWPASKSQSVGGAQRFIVARSRDMFSLLKQILFARCICGQKAVEFPHGIPCCQEHAHVPECSTWVDMDCDCDCGRERS